jgi:hypothetical protein
MRSLTLVYKTLTMLFHHKPLFAYLLTLGLWGIGVGSPVNRAQAQTPVTINQPGSPAVLIDGNKIMDAKPAPSTKPRKPAAPAPADSYTSRGGVP